VDILLLFLVLDHGEQLLQHVGLRMLVLLLRGVSLEDLAIFWVQERRGGVGWVFEEVRTLFALRSRVRRKEPAVHRFDKAILQCADLSSK